MKIALVHNHYDPNNLEKVKEQMLKLGSPKIKVLDLEFDNIYQALEGSHRLRAAEILGITPEFEYVEPHETVAKLDLEYDDPDAKADELGDWENHQIEIEDGKILINAAEYMNAKDLEEYLIFKGHDIGEIDDMDADEIRDLVNEEMAADLSEDQVRL